MGVCLEADSTDIVEILVSEEVEVFDLDKPCHGWETGRSETVCLRGCWIFLGCLGSD